MPHRPRHLGRDQRGFTLVELLVVVLIVAILAAIALPAFLSQRSRAQDVEAKAAVRTAQMAEEAYLADHDAYTSDLTELRAVEPALGEGVAQTGLVVTAPGGKPKAYTVAVTQAKTGVTFTLDRTASGDVSRGCTPAGAPGCGADGSW